MTDHIESDCRPLRGLGVISGFEPTVPLRYTVGFMLPAASRAIQELPAWGILIFPDSTAFSLKSKSPFESHPPAFFFSPFRLESLFAGEQADGRHAGAFCQVNEQKNRIVPHQFRRSDE